MASTSKSRLKRLFRHSIEKSSKKIRISNNDNELCNNHSNNEKEPENGLSQVESADKATRSVVREKNNIFDAIDYEKRVKEIE